VKEVLPEGVLADVVIVSVEVLLLSEGTNETGLGENDADTPLGSDVVMFRVAVKLPEEPPPDPLLTVIV
jgi:hypothetical protein